ncbi:5'/3'-nucleotidase SurE [Actinotalea ferrariae]|uniref:5'/3'-nucleotidase SurE n=1 Tax=Actinotalea ferrariae TaxID=1386098 RepID=UPI001C8B686C|nr:5'/3'-nucleotidase SurE [Actinotalea ferrariae]MBX9245481.1 5'/3'-nucleotidase SurE [Actinotalea ferrariae]
MRALITNDDGIDSPGLAVLARVALDAGYDVVVAAPATEYSGASASLFGLEHDGRVVVEPKAAPGLPDGVESYAVAAAPALIVFLAAYEGFGPRPDLVLSGVNRGPNTGYAVIHSGTVGAATSAMTQGIRGMAVSIVTANPEHWATAGVVAAHGLRWLEDRSPQDGVLNLNVPDLPAADLRGIRVAPLAAFGAVEARIDRTEGEGAVRVRYAEIDPTADADSDAGLAAAGWATATMLQAPWAVDAPGFPETEGPLG